MPIGPEPVMADWSFTHINGVFHHSRLLIPVNQESHKGVAPEKIGDGCGR